MQLSLWSDVYENMLLITSDRARRDARIKALAAEYRRKKAICDAVPVALYRHFDIDARLLYVGISKAPERRLSQHQRHSVWFPLVHSTSVVWIEGLSSAEAAEKSAIIKENPIYNKKNVLNSNTQPAFSLKGSKK